MKYIYLGLGWIFGTSFILVGLMSFTDSFYAALTFILAASLVLPPIRALVFKRLNRRISVKFRGIAVFVLLIAGSVLLGQSGESRRLETEHRIAEQKAANEEAELKKNAEFFIENRATIIAALSDSLDSGNSQAIFSAARKYVNAEDSGLSELVSHAKVLLAEQKRDQEIERIIRELKGIPESQYGKNSKLYSRLVALSPGNVKYETKAEYYGEKVEVARAQKAEKDAIKRKEAARVKRERDAAAAREEQLKTQFSSWNGAHRNLEKYIKSSMHDPDSFKHVETVYWDQGNHLVVRTTFRGTNGFGAVVTNAVKAKVSLTGQVLEILE